MDVGDEANVPISGYSTPVYTNAFGKAVIVDVNVEHNPQQCIGCAACVNACPSNALTVETDLATNELAWQFNLGRC
ncbi:4Fe-4S binding protein, partial [Salmonella enterica subsp. enterica serovar Anatum]|nr:4Fe-4S binding protein [Salmonella enterica subsp. enterica serovar Anatum]